MSASTPAPGFRPTAPILVLAGLVVALAAWVVPVNLKSVSPTLLAAAGQDTPSLSDIGGQLVDSEKIGPAALVLAAAKSVGDPQAPSTGSRPGSPISPRGADGIRSSTPSSTCARRRAAPEAPRS